MTEFEYRIQDPTHPSTTMDRLVMDKETLDVALRQWVTGSHAGCGVYVESRPVVHWERINLS